MATAIVLLGVEAERTNEIAESLAAIAGVTRRGQPNGSPLSERAVYDAPDQTSHKGIGRAVRNTNLRLGFRALRNHSAVMGAQLC
jgi:hypothetical protein